MNFSFSIVRIRNNTLLGSLTTKISHELYLVRASLRERPSDEASEGCCCPFGANPSTAGGPSTLNPRETLFPCTCWPFVGPGQCKIVNFQLLHLSQLWKMCMVQEEVCNLQPYCVQSQLIRCFLLSTFMILVVLL